MTLISFSRSHRHFETQILIEKSLCAHYLLDQWLEFYQTSKDTSLRQGKEVIRFWWPWPHFQGHYIVKTLKMSPPQTQFAGGIINTTSIELYINPIKTILTSMRVRQINKRRNIKKTDRQGLSRPLLYMSICILEYKLLNTNTTQIRGLSQ